MKNKIIFIICTIVILCLGSVVCAGTTLKDIEKTKYENSVNMLVTLGIVNGYPEDNTYRPNNTVTRAEMAKMMVVALGENDKVAAAAKAKTKFNDMNGHWAVGYVNVASELGIINGYPDGKFAPNNKVSYAEATAMILRALEFEEVVSKSTEVWPNNYINQAKKLELYDSVGTFNSNNSAIRGNIAIMLWNMLRTGMCEPVGENSNGLIYGEGEKMLNVKMPKFTYLEDAKIIDIDFDDDYKEADVEFKGDSKIEVKYDALEAAKMYGQKFNILYNKNTKKIELIEKTSENTIKEGEITDIKSSKIYITGGSSRGYELPDDDNILLYGIDDIDEAVFATLVFDGNDLEYVIAFPPEDVYLAIVTANNITVSKKDGIKVVNYKTSSAKSYAVADDSNIPEKDDIILYYINVDNELVILKKADLYESELIKNASKTKITLEEKGKITLGEVGDYEVAKVEASSLKAMSISDIEAEDDSAFVLEFAGKQYIVVYVGGVEAAEKELAEEMSTYKSYLSSYIKKAKGLSEKSYTQASYAPIIKALTEAEKIYALKSPTLSQLKTAYNNLKTAYDGRKAATTTTEKNTVADKYALRVLVNGDVATCVKNKSLYTTDSYNKFNTALTTANNLLAKTNATEKNLENAINNLKTAMAGLVKKTDDTARQTAISKLTTALNKAKNIGVSSNYDSNSYANFKAWWDAAKAVNTTTASTTDIENAAKNLETAITLLDKNTDKTREELNSLLDSARLKLNEKEVYTEESYSKLKTIIDEAELTKSNSNASDETLKKVITSVKNAMNDMVTVEQEFERVIDLANEYKVKLDIDLAGFSKLTYSQKLAKIKSSKNLIKNSLNDLIDAFNEQGADMAIKISHNEAALVDNKASVVANIDILLGIGKDNLKYLKGTTTVNAATIHEGLWNEVKKYYENTKYFVGNDDEEWDINSKFYDGLTTAVEKYADQFIVADASGKEVYLGNQNETKWGEGQYTHFLREAILDSVINPNEDYAIDNYFSDKEFLKYYKHEEDRLKKLLSNLD